MLPGTDNTSDMGLPGGTHGGRLSAGPSMGLSNHVGGLLRVLDSYTLGDKSHQEAGGASEMKRWVRIGLLLGLVTMGALTMGIEGCMSCIYGGPEEHLTIEGKVTNVQLEGGMYLKDCIVTFDNGTELRFRLDVGTILHTGDSYYLECTKPEGSHFWEIDEIRELEPEDQS